MTNRVVMAMPQQRLRNDDAFAVESDGWAFVELVTQSKCLADPTAERDVVRASEDAVDR